MLASFKSPLLLFLITISKHVRLRTININCFFFYCKKKSNEKKIR